MAKKINLTIAERLGMKNILVAAYNEKGLTFETLGDSIRINDKINVVLELDKPDKDGIMIAKGGEEAKAVNMRQSVQTLPDGRVTAQLLWDSKKDKGKVIEFSSDEIKLIKDLINGKSEKKELNLADFWMIEFKTKLETAKDAE